MVSAIKQANQVIIAGHRNPDGDAIGSCLAFALACAEMGTTPIVLLEQCPERFSYLNGSQYIYTGSIDELPGGIMVCVDTSTHERLGFATDVFNRCNQTFCIDHHTRDEDSNYAMVNIIDSSMSSTCELIYTLLDDEGINITSDIAAALYTGMITDSGCFRHPSTTPRTMRIAARLMEAGIDFSMINKQAVYGHSTVEAAVFAAAIGGMRIIPGIKLAISCVDNAQMTGIGADGTDLDGIPEYMLNTTGVEVSAFLSERLPNQVHISFRSINANVRDIAVKFGGGGHIHAAGAVTYGSIEEVAARVIQSVRESGELF